jgi:hypothetical protein
MCSVAGTAIPSRIAIGLATMGNLAALIALRTHPTVTATSTRFFRCPFSSWTSNNKHLAQWMPKWVSDRLVLHLSATIGYINLLACQWTRWGMGHRESTSLAAIVRCPG